MNTEKNQRFPSGKKGLKKASTIPMKRLGTAEIET